MDKWYSTVQRIVTEIDCCIRDGSDAQIALEVLAGSCGYSPYHFSRRFREITGMRFREYLRMRRLAFALKRVRDSRDSLLDIALDHGFSSHAAFSRAFRAAYGVTPSEYRRDPRPVVLRTVIKPLDCYLLQSGHIGMRSTADEVKTYFVTVPAHKFMHIRNYESIGYWDFWQRQSRIPGQDCETVCGLLDSIPGKLDDMGGSGADSGSGQVMAFLNALEGRICSWGIPLAECYGVRLPADYGGPVPEPMLLSDVPEGEYIVFEHGPFDYATENGAVEEKIERAMQGFDYGSSGYCLDTAPGRFFYFYHDCERYWKYVRPVKKEAEWK